MKFYQLFTKSVIYFSPVVLSAVVGLISFPMLAKGLPLSDYGFLDLVNTISSVFIVVAGYGTGVVVQKIVYVEDATKLRSNLGNQLFINVGTLSAGFIVLYFVLPRILANVMSRNIVTPVFIYLFFFATAATLSRYITELYRSRLDSWRFVAVQSVSSVILLFSIVLLASISRLSLFNFLIVSSIGYCIFSLIVLWLAMREVDLTIDFKKIRQYFMLGGATLPMYLITLVNRYSDRWFILKYDGVDSLGLYSINMKLALVCMGVVAAIYSVVLPTFIRLLKQKKVVRLNNYLSLLSLGFLLVSISIFLFGRDFIVVFSKPEYFQNIWTLLFSSVMIYFIFLNHLVYPFVLHGNKVKYMGAAYAVGGILNVGINFAVVPLSGYSGAAFSAMFTQLSIFIVGALLVRTYIPWSIIFSRVITLAIMLIMLFPLANDSIGHCIQDVWMWVLKSFFLVIIGIFLFFKIWRKSVVKRNLETITSG